MTNKNLLTYLLTYLKQVQDQNFQNNADRAPTVANELPSNSKSFTLLLPYTGQKGEHLIRSLRKDMHPRYLKVFKPEYAILVLNLV